MKLELIRKLSEKSEIEFDVDLDNSLEVPQGENKTNRTFKIEEVKDCFSKIFAIRELILFTNPIMKYSIDIIRDFQKIENNDLHFLLKIVKRQRNIISNENLVCFDYKRDSLNKQGKRKWVLREYKHQTDKKYCEEHREECRLKSHFYYLENQNACLLKAKEYRETNKEEKKQRDVNYYLKNKERIKEIVKNYRKDHQEYYEEYRKKYYQEKKQLVLARNRDYRKTEKGKEVSKKHNAKRKLMGFEIIAKTNKNEIMSPTVFHHINNNEVIEIPEWLHRKCPTKPVEKHREKIQELLFPFLNSEYYNIIDVEKFEKYANRDD